MSKEDIKKACKKCLTRDQLIYLDEWIKHFIRYTNDQKEYLKYGEIETVQVLNKINRTLFKMKIDNFLNHE